MKFENGFIANTDTPATKGTKSLYQSEYLSGKKRQMATMQYLNTIVSNDTVLFFDLDGTLVDTDFANYLSYKKAIQSVSESEFNITYNPDKRFNRGLLKNIIPNLTETEYETIVTVKEKCYTDFLSETKLNKELEEILCIYSSTHKTVLVTNCRKDRALVTLKYHNLTDKFSNLFFRQFSNNNKINKFENAIQSLKISPKLVIAFENEDIEIESAKQAGISIRNIIEFNNL